MQSIATVTAQKKRDIVQPDLSRSDGNTNVVEHT